MTRKNALTTWASKFVALIALAPTATWAEQVPKWGRHIVTLQNASYSGTPFALEVDATFRHSATNTQLTLPGYYAGNNTWKVAFMPTLLGEWTYNTSSQDPDLDGSTGSVVAIQSEHRGMLKRAQSAVRKWKFVDGPYVVPLALRFDVFQENGTLSRFTEVADFLRNEVNGHMLEFTLRNEVFLDADAAEFNLELWDRLEQRMDVLSERGLGIHFMFYSDDDQEPVWSERSIAENLLVRYAVARLAAYPVVIYNTGIDISEYRSSSWVDWFGAEIRRLDPYSHPVSSRYGGGSGNLVMKDQTFDSRGDRLALIEDMTTYFERSSVPVSMDDAWSENSPEAASRGKDFTEHDIRRAIWKCVAAGGLGAIIRGSFFHNQDTWFRMSNIEDDLESEQWLGLVNAFIDHELGPQFGSMAPAPSLASNGYALASDDHSKILVLLLGENDRYDPNDGGSVTLHLDVTERTYSGFWFDTRTGQKLPAGEVSGGQDRDFAPPSADDWVLLLSDLENDVRPEPPRSLRAE